MDRRRRKFLSAASLAAVPWASGCSGNADEPIGSPPPETRSRTPAQTRTETKQPHTDAETTTDDPGSPPLADARSKTETAENIYLAWSDQSKIGYLGVTLQSMPRDFERLDRLLGEARDEYRAYLDEHPDESGVHVSLNWARTLHDWARVQFNAIHALWRLRHVRHAVFAQDFTEFDENIEEFDDWISTASEHLENHRRWWGEERVSHLARVRSSVYEAKVLQLQNALHGLSFARGSLDDYVPVSKALVDVLSRYVDDPASVEETTFENLLADQTRVETDVEEFHCGTHAVEGFLGVYRDAISAANAGTKQLQSAAAAAREGDPDGRITHEKRAKSAFMDSELLVKDQGKVADLVAQLEE